MCLLLFIVFGNAYENSDLMWIFLIDGKVDASCVCYPGVTSSSRIQMLDLEGKRFNGLFLFEERAAKYDTEWYSWEEKNE